MRISMHNWMRPEPLETTVERLARLGYDGIELSAEPATQDPREVRALLERHGLACSGTLALMMGGRDLYHEDSYIRAASAEYLRDCIRLAHELGGAFVTVPPTVGKVTPMGSPEDEWGWYVEGLKSCLDLAGELGIGLALEPINRFETYLINRSDQALALAEAVGGPSGVVLDIYHMNQEEADWRAALTAAGPRLLNFHVADNNRLAPGRGAIDWANLVEELRRVGYEGWLAVEFMPPLDRTPVSQRADIADAAEADISQGMVQWLRDHGSGVLPEALYEEEVRQSVECLRSAIGATR